MLRPVTDRLAFVKDSTAAGWQWLVGLSNQLGAIVLGLLVAGVSVVSAIKLPYWWLGALILSGVYVLLSGEGAFRVSRQLRGELAEAKGQLGEVDLRLALVTYLRAQKDQAAPIARWIAAGLTGHEYYDARGAGDDWTNPIFLKLLGYDQELARLFTDDGGELYPSTMPGEFLGRRLEQLDKVIRELERRRD